MRARAAIDGRFVALAALGLATTAFFAAGLPPGAGAPGFAWRAVPPAIAWAGATALAWNRRDRATWALVLGLGVAMRVLAATWPADLSSDVHRYVWDARVADSGVSPYAAPPDSPSLSSLRDPIVWPRVNRPSAPTVYPPGAQAWFLAMRRAGVRTARGVRAASALCDGLSLGLLALLLRRRGAPPGRLAVYAWSPLVVAELSAAGHVEAAVVPLALAALLLCQRRPAWAGAAVGAATLLKLYPALLLVAPAAGAPRRRAAVACAAVVATGYAPFWAASGPRALGFLPDYFRVAEDFNVGLRGFVQAAVAPLLGGGARPAAFALCAIALALAVARIAGAPGDKVARARHAAGAFLVLLPSALHPWYAAWIVPLAALAPSPAEAAPWLWLAATLPLSYLKYGAPGGTMPAWVPLVEFVPVYVLLLRPLLRERGRGRGRASSTSLENAA